MGFKIKGSWVAAVVITASIAGWMSTGDVVVGGQANSPDAVPPPAQRTAATEAEPFRVQVKTVSAESRQTDLKMRGRTEADARVPVRAETSGRVAERPVEAGNEVKAGDVLCQLDRGAREAQLLKAEAEAAKAKLEFEAATKLRERQFESATRVAATKASLDAATATVAEAQLELDRTTVKAPVSGTVEDPMTDQGAMLAVGDVCATIIDVDPITVTGQISERDIGKVSNGMKAHVSLVTGEEVDGEITFISRAADPATRTFTVEIQVPNPDGKLHDGVTALASIPLEPVRLHRLSPAVLTLADSGTVGVQTVSDKGTVAFEPVTIVDQGPEGVWVKGLPETITVIVVGQDYVVDGETVTPVEDQPEARS
ncbi:efflux RND transporter periplasmic adaptor subunit [Amorphus coralli]|uniref:efflux RND transporter periplasmic adaptor subunit n=1 Tax=Amorphus coralli TaxID=340680 RepID=UPI000360E86F|nr:efflux RND transporter periplasmic adaptor subunit [Amorphus coralli]